MGRLQQKRSRSVLRAIMLPFARAIRTRAAARGLPSRAMSIPRAVQGTLKSPGTANHRAWLAPTLQGQEATGDGWAAAAAMAVEAGAVQAEIMAGTS